MSNYLSDAQLIDDIMNIGSARESVVASLVLDYFEHYNILPPKDIFVDVLEDEFKVLIYGENLLHFEKALKSVAAYAKRYHEMNTKKIVVDGITKATILKIIKRTDIGDRVNEMGIGGKTTGNLQKGFVGLNVVEFIINDVFNPDRLFPSVLRAFETKKKCAYIRDKMYQLTLKKRL